MIRVITLHVAVLAMTIAVNAIAQALPATDLWLARIEAGLPVQPVRISSGNGYNNQPHFSVDGSAIYYTREIRTEYAPPQTDIAAFDTRTSTTTMLIQTAESEYSPTPIPGRGALSVIRVEPDQKQRLWAIDIASGRMDLLLPQAEPVGYHSWINQTDVAMFILGEVFTLQIASLDKQGSRIVANNIGRSIRTHPHTNDVLFVAKNPQPWQIAAFDIGTNITKGQMSLFPGNEDFTIDEQGDYWTGNGSKLYKRSPGDKRWSLVADFRVLGIDKISRLAVNLNSKQIAFVTDHVVTD